MSTEDPGPSMPNRRVGNPDTANTDSPPARAEELSDQCAALADRLLADLRAELGLALGPMSDTPADQYRDVLHRVHQRWANSTTWRLINAADPCGT
jgi:hypothetical protein